MITRCFATALLIGLLATTATAETALRGGAQPLRRLDGGDRTDENANYGFLINQIRDDPVWCLTAVEGTEVLGNLGFRPCEFQDEPKDQLWALDSDGKLHSALDYDLCFIVGTGKKLDENVRARLGLCTTAPEYTEFVWDAGNTDQFQVKSNPSFCATNRGPNPNKSDTIHLKTCQKTNDYKWTFQPLVTEPDPEPDAKHYLIQQDDGCMSPVTDGGAEGTRVVLAECDTASFWRILDNGDGTVSIATENVAENACMQVGSDGLVMFTPGVKIRLGNCEDTDVQKYTWPDLDGIIAPVVDSSLGIEYLGAGQDIGEDIVLKNADALVGTWAAVESGVVKPAPEQEPELIWIKQDGGCMSPMSDGGAEGTKVVLESCDAASAWRILDNADGTVSIATPDVEEDACMQVGSDGLVNFKQGVKIRLGNCEDTDVQKYTWPDLDGIIAPVVDSSLGLEYLGPEQDIGEDIVLKNMDALVGTWTAVKSIVVDPEPEFFLIFQDGYCMSPVTEGGAEGTRVILESCDAASAWRITGYADGTVSMATANIEENACMQVGSDGLVIFKPGVKIRLGNCEDTSVQRFLWPQLVGVIVPVVNTTFGLEYLGPSQDLGEDIVLKNTDSIVGGWSGLKVE